ncbi:WD40 repeat domain-containing protein [Aeoliella sp. SH292]|uniref:WD40 repeat domain-containing protein n=1 Tax=Aeoliella sp. SH292 TaxID=3454464 RepID=UPI003F9D1B50
MDATFGYRYRSYLAATLATALMLAANAATADTTAAPPCQVLSFGDPECTDENPQRHTAAVTAVVMSADGKQLAAAGDDHRIRVFDPATGELRHQLAAHHDWVRGLSISSDGSTLVAAAADCCCTTWNAATGEQLSTTSHTGNALRTVAFHPNGLQFAAAGFGCAPSIFNLSGGHLSMQLDCPRQDYTCLAFSPDGSVLAVGSADGTLRMWNTASAQLLHEIKADERRLRAVTFASDGQTVATGGDGRSVKLWSVADGSNTQEMYVRPAKVFSLRYLNAEEIAVGGTDNRVQIWRVDGPSLVRLLEGHTGTVSSLACDASGEVLASGSFDTTIRIWTLGNSAANKTATLPAAATR